ncbi:FAD-binding protein [Flavobacteriaceae bacterium 3-367]
MMKSINPIPIFLLGLLIVGLYGCHPNKEKVSSLSIKSMDAGYVSIASDTLEKLKASIAGQLLTEEDSEYTTAIEIWNSKRQKRRPAVVIKCQNEQDVVKTINFVRTHGLLLSVKGGGHNSSGFALNDGGLVLDLSQMDAIAVDPEKKTVRVGPGVRWGQLDEATQAYGLATTGAIISQVGIGGYTLGGGLGWLHRSLGAASDNLISARMVTADGALLQLSENENSDFFWAIRGGGGNFGVVTFFEFKLHEVGPEILAGLVFYRMSDAKKVVRFYREYIKEVPDALGTWLLFRKAPISAQLPEEIHGEPIVAIAITYNGPISEGEDYSAPLRNIVPPVADLVKTRTYTAWQSSLDGAWGNGFHNIWKGHYFMEVTDEIVEVLQRNVPQGSPYSDVKIQHLEGAFGRMPEHATAFGNRKSRFGMVIQTRWLDSLRTTEQELWTNRLFNELKQKGTGKVYVNFMDNEGENRVKDAYSDSTFIKLKKIKKKYDPENLFRKNQNIKPD